MNKWHTIIEVETSTDPLIGVETTTAPLIEALAKCTKQLAHLATKIVKFLSNQMVTDLYIAGIATNSKTQEGRLDFLSYYVS